MKEIKFRAWDKKENKFEDYFQIDCKGTLAIFNPMKCEWERAEDDRYNLMQFTGLKDKNGKEIYEGDIVEKDRGDGKEIFEIVWDNGSFHISKNGEIQDYLLGHCNSGKIIGNKFESKELIKDTK